MADPSPYDILDISPAADAGEIMKAYQRALKARRFPPATIARAFGDLRNPRKRAAIDLLTFCRLGVEGPRGEPVESTDPDPLCTVEAALLPIEFPL
jgi:DnaJ-class molecular chaperone